MKLKTLHIKENLRESITYGERSIPISIYMDNFDDCFHRQWECHWHEEIEFGVVQNGVAEITVYSGSEQSAKVLRQGDGIFINSEYMHSAKALEPNTIIAVFVLPITFFYKPFENAAHQIVSPVTESEVMDLVFRASNAEDKILLSGIREICLISDQETGHELHYIEMVCKIWRLLTIRILQDEKAGQTAAVNNIQEQRTKQMLAYIYEHYSEHIRIDDMAKSAAVSRTECFRCFRATLNKTPAEYITEYRLSMASMMLANTTRPLSDISFSCGFNNPSYFGKIFHEQCGMTPKKYREQFRENRLPEK